jgi:hypothetical protein
MNFVNVMGCVLIIKIITICLQCTTGQIKPEEDEMLILPGYE